MRALVEEGFSGGEMGDRRSVMERKSICSPLLAPLLGEQMKFIWTIGLGHAGY